MLSIHVFTGGCDDISAGCVRLFTNPTTGTPTSYHLNAPFATQNIQLRVSNHSVSGTPRIIDTSIRTIPLSGSIDLGTPWTFSGDPSLRVYEISISKPDWSWTGKLKIAVPFGRPSANVSCELSALSASPGDTPINVLLSDAVNAPLLVTINNGNGNVASTSFSSAPLTVSERSIPVTYTAAGNFSLTVSAPVLTQTDTSGPFDDVVYTKSFNVILQNKVERLVLPDPTKTKYVLPWLGSGTMNHSLGLLHDPTLPVPTSPTCLYDYMNGYSTTLQDVALDTAAPLMVFSFDAYGIHNVEVTCWNIVSISTKLVITFEIVPFDMSLLKVTVPNHVAMTGGCGAQVPFTLSAADAVFLPSLNATWSFTPGLPEAMETVTARIKTHPYPRGAHSGMSVDVQRTDTLETITLTVPDFIVGVLQVQVDGTYIVESHLVDYSNNRLPYYTAVVNSTLNISMSMLDNQEALYFIQWTPTDVELFIVNDPDGGQWITNDVYNQSDVFYNHTIQAVSDTGIEIFELAIEVKDLPEIVLRSNWTNDSVPIYFVPYPPGVMDVEIYLLENVFVPPESMDCELFFSDGENATISKASLSYTAPTANISHRIPGERNGPHPFPRPIWLKEGLLTLNVSCGRTGASAKSEANMTMLVVEGIAELTITPKYPFSNVNFLAPFDLMITSGQGVTITVDFGDGTAPVSQPAGSPYVPRIFDHTYTAAGVYSIFVNASNIYQQETTNLTYTVIQKTSYSIQDFNITVVDPTPFPLDSVSMFATINLHVDVYLAPSPPPGVRILQDCGDGVLNEVAFTSFDLQCNVSTLGLLTMNSQVILPDGTSATYKREVSVIRPCAIPTAAMPLHQTLTTRLRVKRSQPFDVAASVTTDCRDLVPRFTWRVRELVYDVNAVGQWKYGSNINWLNVSASSVFFVDKILPVGVYEANITVEMVSRPDLRATARMFFEVEKGPLTVAIVGGTTRSLDRVGDLILDAESVSADEDDLAGNFTFSWSCTTITSLATMPLIALVTPTTPPLDNVSCGNPLTSEGKQQFNNAAFPDGVWHLFRVTVTKDDRFGVFEQALRYGAALKLTIV